MARDPDNDRLLLEFLLETGMLPSIFNALFREDQISLFQAGQLLQTIAALMNDEEYGGEVADSALAQDALMPELNDNYEGIDQLVKSQDQLAASVQESRRLVKTILDQGHISPFVSSTRPVIWNLDHTLHLTPIPSLMVICDTTASQFEVTYNGCKSVNVGSFLYKRRARYVEYRPSSRKVVREEVYF